MVPWSATTAITKGQRILPTSRTGYFYRAQSAGTTGASEPAWPLTAGVFSALDGSITWQCAGFAPYFDQAAAEDRLSAAVVKRLLDDNRDGFADGSSFERLQLDACAYVNGFFRKEYAKAMPFRDPLPEEVVRLSLDVFEAYAAKRHPRLVQRDWAALMSGARQELVDLSAGRTRLDVLIAPEPAANTGGSVRSGDPKNPAPKPKFFTDDMGDF